MRLGSRVSSSPISPPLAYAYPAIASAGAAAQPGWAWLAPLPVDPAAAATKICKLLDAGTFWYHPHLNETEQLEKGLYGALIVRAADIKGQEQIAVEGIGLRAIAEGFAALGLSDEERLVRQFPVYDALYEYARQAP